MKQFKKLLALVLVGVLCLCCFAACGKTETTPSETPSDNASEATAGTLKIGGETFRDETFLTVRPKNPPIVETSYVVRRADEPKPADEPAKQPETKQEVKQTTASGGIRVSTRKAEIFNDPKPEYRYYVMIGTFGSRDNAVRLSGKAGEAGYPVTLLPFGNGMTTVAVCPTNDFGDVCAALEKLRKESFCPKDACILKIE